jgi:predicted PurR-regulated permease PerM
MATEQAGVDEPMISGALGTHDVDAAEGKPSPFAPPRWASDTGRWGWIIIAVVLVAVCAFVVLAAIKLVVLAALFAILIGGTFLPIVDWLARHHVKRWIAAFLVVIFLILLAVGICLVVLYGLVNQWPEIQDNLQKAWDSIQKSLNSTTVSKEQMDSAKANLQNALKAAASGATSAVVDLIGGVAGLAFGVFISINILVWVLIQGREIGGWASRHMPPVPQPVAYAMLANSARFFRGYIYGSTIVGLFNGAVIFVGALIIGVPLAATLGLVAWMTNYIPYFGAIISGAFAVLVAWGAGGPSMGIPMLIIVIIANGFLQTLVSQFALGSALNLHPLSVLFATTAGGILFGAVGGVFAAPFLKIGVDSYGLMKDAGLFGAKPVPVSGDEPGAGEPPGHGSGPDGGAAPPSEAPA